MRLPLFVVHASLRIRRSKRCVIPGIVRVNIAWNASEVQHENVHKYDDSASR